METVILQAFENSLPYKPYCTNDFMFGTKILPKNAALQKKYIQFNTPNTLKTITIDLDYETNPLAISPEPNIVILNPKNNHAHAMYMLEKRINNKQIQTRASNYAKDTLEGLRSHLNGDPCFNHHIAKNPLNDSWEVYTPNAKLWTLDDLWQWMGKPPKTKREARLEVVESGGGRNCHVFDTARYWAYSAVCEYLDLGYSPFAAAVLNKCLEINQDFETPLPSREVRWTAESIAGYCWKNKDTFLKTQWHQAQRLKGLKTRQNKKAQLKEQAIAMLGQGFIIQEIADTLGVARRTIAYWINGR